MGIGPRQRFRNRRDAGRMIAPLLSRYRRPDVLVLGLPRGGVPVAFEVAQALDAPLDVFMVRKIGAPGQEELAMAAIATGGTVALNPEVISMFRVPWPVIERAIAVEMDELARRERAYRGDAPPPQPAGKTLILVDDGLATGSSMRAAIAAVKERKPARIVVAVPVAPPETCALLEREADEVICPVRPPGFRAVGLWYEDFSQTTDEEVRELLAQARGRERRSEPGSPDEA